MRFWSVFSCHIPLYNELSSPESKSIEVSSALCPAKLLTQPSEYRINVIFFADTNARWKIMVADRLVKRFQRFLMLRIFRTAHNTTADSRWPRTNWDSNHTSMQPGHFLRRPTVQLAVRVLKTSGYRWCGDRPSFYPWYSESRMVDLSSSCSWTVDGRRKTST